LFAIIFEPTVAPTMPSRSASRTAEALRTPAPRAAAPAPARPAPAQPSPEPRAAQPRLNLDTTDRRTSGGGVADEHLLDIPAFLRRQAN
jgi:cell division protein FtsZ